MKKLPTLTIAALILAGCGMRLAMAWQGPTDKTDTSNSERAAAVSAEPARVNDPEAVHLVQQARNQLFERQSVQAKMAETVSLGGVQFRSQGAYLASTGFRYRLEYRVKLEGLQGDFLEVCDGQILHTRRQISEADAGITSTKVPEIEVSRRDIQAIRREALTLKESKTGQQLADSLRVAEMGIGGLPAVLASLERSMIFTGVQPEAVQGREYLVVQGHWRTDRRDRLFAGLGAAGNQIAGFLPDRVRIFFEKSTLFPEKFVYLKRTSEKEDSYLPLITVEFQDVVLDHPVPDQKFVFAAPPGVEEKDETASFIEAMRQTADPAGTAAAKKK